jgi:N,N'-diacetyllegionaminate synthase
MKTINWLREDGRVFVIAEAGINHNGDMQLVKRMIDIASDSGADAVKFQTYNAEKLLVQDAPKAQYQRETTGAQESQLDMLKRVELSRDQHIEIINYCGQKDLTFISTPFEEDSADLLEELGVPFFKIPSGEITNFPFLEHVARKQRPIILSTGMSFLGEVERAVQLMQNSGCRQLVLLHCVSNYPASVEDVNLKAMRTMQKAFELPVGYSDHTPGFEAAIAAVALGAKVIEKHFTIDKKLSGPDHRASVDPKELVQLITAIRNVECALGDGIKKPVPAELSNREIIRKGLYFGRNLSAGTIIKREMVVAKRPASVLDPTRIGEVVGRKLVCDVQAHAPVTQDILIR